MSYTNGMQHWLQKFINGFTYAFRGIAVAFGERNMRVHGVALFAVLLVSWWLKISQFEWLIVLLVSAAVMAAEVVNTALESLCNVVRDELGAKYDSTKNARDLAAGAVLILALCAAIIGLVIFGPKILVLI